MNPFERFPVTSIGGVNALKAALDFIAAMKELEHMNINATYKRAVRIIGKPGLPHGKAIIIYDALTEEQIMNVESASIHLDATGVSTVVLGYYATNEQGAIMTDAQKEPIQGRTAIIREKHEIDVTAFEV